MSGRPVAFITGAAHGQGRAVALALAKEGHDVAALDVAAPLDYPGYGMGTPAELESLQGEIGALTLVADVRDDAAVKAAVEETIERFGRIDLLFNNAGICAYGLAHELTEAEWDAMLDINLKGAFIVGRHVIPHMIAAQRGSIHGTGSRLPADRSAISRVVIPSSCARPSLSGVSTPVGWMETTRMPWSASSIAHDFVRPVSPHLLAA